MKVVVLSFSGNVGKSTIARHLLAPRMGDASVIAVESINSDAEGMKDLRGAQFKQLLLSLPHVKDAVIDVGASEVEDFLGQMSMFEGSEEDFDFFVVPTVAELKQQRDAVSTIAELARLGIAADRIRVVFNKVPHAMDVPAVFEPILAFHEKTRYFDLRPGAVVHENELFELLRTNPVDGIGSLLDDKTDYKAAIIASGDAEERHALALRLATRRLAMGVSRELDHVFTALFKS